jgi:hypothetical protein
MSETKHTPGPWEAERLPQDAGSNVRPWVGRLSEYKFAALTCGETQDEAVANARLIAAAPDMYEALKAVASLKGWDEREPVSATGRQVLAAIAKAEGR